MTLLHRRLIYIIFILAFAVITPAILFYASGYNFNFSSNAIERTGILIIETTPKGASVNLGEAQKYSWLYTFFYGEEPLNTPIKARNLLPGDYDITVSKLGYFDYRKKIKLLPGQTVVLDDIILLKRAYPQAVLTDFAQKTSLSPDGSRLAVVTEDNLVVVSLNNGRLRTIPLDKDTRLPQTFDITWSPRANKLLLDFAPWPVYDVENGQKLFNLPDTFLTGEAQVRWDEADESKIYSLKQGVLSAFDINQKNTTPVLVKDGLQDFLVKDGIFYTLERDQNGNRVAVYRANNTSVEKIIGLPPTRSYTFAHSYTNVLYVHDAAQAVLHIVDPWSFLPLQDSVTNVRDFSINGNTVVYWNDFEIWTYHQATKTRVFLTRISKHINDATADAEYVYYNTDEALNSLEQVDREFLNMNVLADWQKTEALALSANGKYLYFISPFEAGRGLYRLEIK